MRTRLIVFLLLTLSFITSNGLAADKVVVIPLISNKAMKLQNVVTVSASGADFTNPVAAVNSIADASTENPYLVVIGPGVYTLTQTLVMKEYVSIMGSGEQTTRLNGAVSTNTNDAGSSLVSGANNTTLSDLTVENIVVGNLSSIAIYNNNCSPKIINVSTITSGGGSAIGVFNTSSSSPTMTNVSVTVSGTSTTTGVLNDSSSPVIDNVTVTVTGGTASTCGVTNQNASAPTIKNLTVTTSGGVGNHVGILNDYSSPTMNNVNVKIMGTDSNIGISNISSSPIMINVNAEALGGTDAIGVKSRDSLPMMTYVIANASGGSNTNIGYLSPFNMDGSYLGIAKFRHCVFKGITYGLYTDALHDYIFISQSSIIGGLYFGVATINCLNSDNGELQEFGLDCIEKDIEP